MWPVPTDPVQCIGRVESALKDLHWILPPSVTGIMQNCMLCHFYKLEGSVLSLESPAGRDAGVASPNQSCTAHWQRGVCMETPALDTTTLCDRNHAKWDMSHFNKLERSVLPLESHLWTRYRCGQSQPILCSALAAWSPHGNTCTGNITAHDKN